jgi:hypothetical protein
VVTKAAPIGASALPGSPCRRVRLRLATRVFLSREESPQRASPCWWKRDLFVGVVRPVDQLVEFICTLGDTIERITDRTSVDVEILTAGVHVGDHSSRELGRLLSILTQLLLERCNLLDVNELARAGGAIRVAAGPRKKPSSPG